MSRPLGIPLAAFVLAGLCMGVGSGAAAQSAALEFGVGGAPGVAGGSGAAVAAVAVPLGGRLGARLGVAWTAGRVLAAGEATVALETGVSVFKPQLIVGGGYRAGGGEGAAVVTGGLGLIGRVSRRVDGFVEGRGVWGGGDDPRGPSALILVGLRYVSSRGPR